MEKKKNLGHVLYVEDDKTLRHVITIQLKAIGCKVTTAIHGQDALEKMAKKIPDLVLTDAMMPVMNGYDLVKEIQRSAKFKKIPVVFISANPQDSSRELAFSGGAVDYLRKPVAMKELVAKVKNFLDLAAAHKETRKKYTMQIHQALENIDSMQNQTHILAEIMKQLIPLRQLKDIHNIADEAAKGIYKICHHTKVNFWRHLSGKPVLIGTNPYVPSMSLERQQAIVSTVFEKKEPQIEIEGLIFLFSEGYVMEVIHSSQKMTGIMDILNLFFSHIAVVFNSFKDAAVYKKISDELKNILQIRNDMVEDLDKVRQDSNTNISNLGVGLEAIIDIAYKDKISQKDHQDLQQIANDTLTLTQFGDTSNQKIFAIIHSLSQIFDSLEAEVSMAPAAPHLSLVEVSSESIAMGDSQSNQGDVDDLLSSLGL